MLEPATDDPGERSLGLDFEGRHRVGARCRARTRPQQIGTIELAIFQNPAGLLARGGNLFTATTASGDATTGVPGTDGLGTIAQGFLEDSNVSVVEEMVNMILGPARLRSQLQGHPSRRRDAPAGQQPVTMTTMTTCEPRLRRWPRCSSPPASPTAHRRRKMPCAMRLHGPWPSALADTPSSRLTPCGPPSRPTFRYQRSPEPGARTGAAVRFVLFAGGARIGTAVATVHVTATHLRARRAIARGEAVGAQDIEEVQAPLLKQAVRRLPSFQDVVGARLRRNMAAGEPHYGRDHGCSGHSSRPVTRSASWYVSVALSRKRRATASGSGHVGDIVRVIRPGRRRPHQSTYHGTWRVEILP